MFFLIYTRLFFIFILCGLTRQSNAGTIVCYTCTFGHIQGLNYSNRRIDYYQEIDGMEPTEGDVPGKPRQLSISTSGTTQTENSSITEILIRWRPPDDGSIRALLGFEVYIADLTDSSGYGVQFLMDLRSNTEIIKAQHMTTKFNVNCTYTGPTEHGRDLYIEVESLPESSLPAQDVSDKRTSTTLHLPTGGINVGEIEETMMECLPPSHKENQTLPLETTVKKIGEPHNNKVITVVVIVVVFIVSIITVVCFLKFRGIICVNCEKREINEEREQDLEIANGKDTVIKHKNNEYAGSNKNTEHRAYSEGTADTSGSPKFHRNLRNSMHGDDLNPSKHCCPVHGNTSPSKHCHENGISKDIHTDNEDENYNSIMDQFASINFEIE